MPRITVIRAKAMFDFSMRLTARVGVLWLGRKCIGGRIREA